MTEVAVFPCSTNGCDHPAVAYWHDAGPFGAGTFYGCADHAPGDATPVARAEQTAQNCGPGGGVLPAGMTADKLRQVADYITESDGIMEKWLRKAREQGREDVTDDVLAFVTGKAMQDDLRAWADEIERAEGTGGDRDG